MSMTRGGREREEFVTVESVSLNETCRRGRQSSLFFFFLLDGDADVDTLAAKDGMAAAKAVLRQFCLAWFEALAMVMLY